MAERKPFERLLDEVVNEGKCSLCGACQNQCTAEGAFAVDVASGDVSVHPELCTECRSCLVVCPELASSDRAVDALAGEGLLGNVLDVSMMTTGLWRVRSAAGGVVTSLLLHLLESGEVTGVVIPSAKGAWGSGHVLVKTPEELLAATGNRVGKLTTIALRNGRVSNLSVLASLRALHAADPDGGDWAVVALPCEAYTIARMRVEKVEPYARMKHVIGLFCFTNLPGHAAGLRKFEQATGMTLGDLASVSFGGTVRLTNAEGETRELALEEALRFGPANCQRCADVSARFSDISIGAVGAWPGFSTVVARTRGGLQALRRAQREGYLRAAADVYSDAPERGSLEEGLVRSVQGLAERKMAVVLA